MKVLALAWRQLRREWRGGELRALLAALVITVTALTSVGFFTDRIQRALELQASEFLGADLVVESSSPLPMDWARSAHRLGLRTAETVSFPSVVLAGEQTQLAALKAVDKDYPLRGRVRLTDRLFGPERAADAAPPAGSAWVEPRLASALNLAVGDTVEVGASRFRVAALLAYEPDRAGEFFNVAPRLMLQLGDLPATQLIQPGSRVNYRLLLAGETQALQAFREWAAPQLDEGLELQGVRDARPELRNALDRGGRFLGLAALVSVVLSGVAIAVAARRYAARHLDHSAILRCFGAEQAFVSRLYLLQLALLGVLGGTIGSALGYGAQTILAALLAGLLNANLPAPSWTPALAGLAAGLVVLYGFALPPLMRLRQVPPVRVLRGDVGPLPPAWYAVYGGAGAALAGLILWQAADLRLALIFIVGTVATLVVLGGFAWLLVRSLAGLRHRVGVAWRFGLANIPRRARSSTVQVLGFGLGIMALLLLTLIRNDLLADWQRSLPPGAPNQFAINIQADQLAGVRQFFEARDRGAPTLYPMVRGRLVAINDREVSPSDYENPRAQRLAAREFNLSWTSQLPADNAIVEGRWWQPADAGDSLFSVEAGLAETLGIRLGDMLTYQVAGETIAGRVVSLRSVNWDSFRPNFFVIAPPGLLDRYPSTWISSFYLAGEDKDLLNDLVRSFPNITILDVEALMTQVRNIMDRVALAVEYVFVFTLLAGLVVLYAAIQSTQDERRHEGAILRTLGASRRQLLLGTISEFAAIGVLAGLLGAIGASAVAYVMAEHVLGLGFQIRPYWWLVGMLAGGFGVAVAGAVGTRGVLNRPPLQTLRKA